MSLDEEEIDQMNEDSDRQLELVESDIWEVVRRSIEAEALVLVMESATRIAAAHPNVMSVAEIAELLVDAAIAARLPIDVEGLPLTARGFEHPPAASREVAAR